MKKLINKIRKKEAPPVPSRITSETVAQHREKILAGGRRFKYPIQYARHKLVINAIIIGVTAVIVAIAIGWWQLYPEQNTSEFMYSVTKVIPVPVAMVDGQPVLYSDYLMVYRSSVYFLEQKQQLNPKTEDGKRQIDYIKQQTMEGVIADAYALKLSKGLGVSVSDSELEVVLKGQRQLSDGEMSQQVYDTSAMDVLGLNPSEYRHKISNSLLRQKVSYAMDKDATNAINSIDTTLKKDPKTIFKTLAATVSTKTGLKIASGTSGWVPKTNLNGGLAIEAAKLKKLELSSVIKSTIGDGYYIIRLTDINDDQVNYDYIQVPLTAFSKALDKVNAEGKVQKYISISNPTK